ncbi:P-type DNA transfer ATPase VirB11 [Flavobacteriaceae bacterium (ex Bugula neritina AB1)]|nr:P-type DNA transfer ATPase VirB11 [Flavobacteriaceae bacterium (ex Bugula neritina AB1)]
MTLKKCAALKDRLKKIDPYINKEGVTEIAINRPGEIWIQKHNEWFKEDDHKIDYDYSSVLVTQIASYNGSNIENNSPMLSSILPNGERVEAVMPPACEPETISITIRKPSQFVKTLEEYRNEGFFSKGTETKDKQKKLDDYLLEVKDTDRYNFLKLAVRHGKTIAVIGETGSGKTTLGKALINEIDSSLRVITIEDVRELITPNHPNRVHLLYPNACKPDDPVTPTKLLKSCLRMNPDRIFLAEVRGGEAFDFINTVNSGHAGSITSFHANSAENAFERLALMCLQNPMARGLPWGEMMKLIKQAIDVIIHVDNDIHSESPIGRHITEIYYNPKVSN